jgi:hypothetical protein
VAKKELNLLRFATGGAAEPSTASTEIVRCEFGNSNFGGDSTGATHTPEELSRVNSGGVVYIRSASCVPNSGREWFEPDQPFRASPRLPNALRAATGGRKSARQVHADGVHRPAGGQPVAQPEAQLLDVLTRRIPASRSFLVWAANCQDESFLGQPDSETEF